MRSSSPVVRVGLAVAMATATTGCLLNLPVDDDHVHLQIDTEVEMTAECGKAPELFPLEIYNWPDKDFTIAGATVTGDFAVVDSFPIVFRGNETGALSIRAPLAVVGTDPPLNTKTGEVVLATSEGDFPVVLIAQTIDSNMEITDTASRPLSLAFSGSQCPAPITGMVTNRGNKELSVSAPAPSGFRIDGFVNGPLAPGASRTFTVRPYTTSACSSTEAISFTATGPLCAIPPVIQASFTMTGSASCSCL